MRRGGANHQEMENLMRMPQNIKTPRPQSFRYTRSIEPGPDDIQRALQQQPTKPNLPHHKLDAEYAQTMQDGQDSRQTHAHEHSRAEGPPRRGAELREHRYGDAA